MDLLLAYLCKQKLEAQGRSVDAWQLTSLVFASRAAKERLLSDGAVASAPVAIASKGRGTVHRRDPIAVLNAFNRRPADEGYNAGLVGRVCARTHHFGLVILILVISIKCIQTNAGSLLFFKTNNGIFFIWMRLNA